MQQAVVDLLDFGVLEIGVVVAGRGQVLRDVGDRVDHRLAVEVDRDVEVAGLAQDVVEHRRRVDLLIDGQADLLPLVHQPGADDPVGLIDGAVVEGEAQTFLPGFLQQAPRLGAAGLQVAAKAGDLHQLFLGRRQRVVGEHDAADRLDDGDLGQVLRAAPAVDRQGQRLAHPWVVERRAAVVRGYHQHAVPVALLDGDLVAQCVYQVITLLRRETAELDRRAVALDRLNPGRHLRRRDRLEAVQIGPALVVIVLVLHPRDESARLVLDEHERPGAVDVHLVPSVAVLVEILLRVDEGIGIRHRRQERARRERQLEDHGEVVGCGHRLDHLVERLACRRDALRREDDLFPGRHDVGRGQRRAVVELDALADLEGEEGAALRARRHIAFAQVALEVGRIARIGRVDPHQQAVERRDRMDHAEGGLDMAVIGRDLRADDEIQRAAVFRRLRHRTEREGGRGHRTQRKFPQFGLHQYLPGLLTVDFRDLSVASAHFPPSLLGAPSCPGGLVYCLTPPYRPPSGLA